MGDRSRRRRRRKERDRSQGRGEGGEDEEVQTNEAMGEIEKRVKRGQGKNKKH